MLRERFIYLHVLHIIYVNMVNLTLSLPDELKKEMDKLPEINWSEVARASIRQKVLLLKEINEFARESEFTEEDAIRLGREVNRAAAKKFRKLCKR